MAIKEPKVALRRLIIGGLVLLVIGLVLVAASKIADREPVPKKTAIGLMTSLALRWPEMANGQLFDADAAPSEAFQRLQRNQPITLLDDFKKLSVFRVLVLAQSRALAPGELVALDNWIRAGGRALILADPALAWESSYPLGDRRRPLFTSLLSPLYAHWGLQLVLDIDAKSRDTVVSVRKETIRTQTIGGWVPDSKSATARCHIGKNRILADCKIGKGRAVLLADADLLNDINWTGTGIRALMGSDDFGNIDLVERLIDDLQQ